MATRRGTDNSVRVAISGTMNSVAWANVFWCQLTTSGTPSQADLDTWLSAFQAAYKTNFQSLSSSTVLYTQAQAGLFLPGSLFLPSVVAMTGAGTGTAMPNTEPQDASIVLSWQTGVYWRGGKPRTYIPGPNLALTANKQLASGAITSATTAATGFRTAINGLTSGAISATVLGLMSFQTAGTPRVPPVFFAFTGAKVHPRIGSQRRRLGKWLP